MNLSICENPIFIIGSPRSGTSILAWSLAAHSQLEVFAESNFLWDIFGGDHAEKTYETFERDYKERVMPALQARTDGTDWLIRYDVSRSEFLGYLGAGLNALMSRRCPGKRWIDQTPRNTLMADKLAELFPGAFFLHILRDGRKVVHSMINFEKFLGKERAAKFRSLGFLPNWAADFSEACRTWSWYVENAMSFCAARLDRSTVIINENLQSDPDKQFAAIFERLGLSYEPYVAEFFRTYRINSSFCDPAGESDGTKRIKKTNDPWQEWSNEQRSLFGELAAPTMIKYGLATEGAFNRRDKDVSEAATIG